MRMPRSEASVRAAIRPGSPAERRTVAPPAQIDEARRPGRGAPDGVDHGEVPVEERLADDRLDGGAVLRRERAGGGLYLLGPEIVRGRVDEVAPERRRLGDARDLLGVDAVRRDEPDGLCRAVAIAPEAIAAE